MPRAMYWNGSEYVELAIAGPTGPTGPAGADGLTQKSGVLLTDAAQSVASGSAVDITWGTEVSDLDGWTSGGSATLTVPSGKAGRYAIAYLGTWASSPSSGGQGILINGTMAATAPMVGLTLYISTVYIPCYTLAEGDTIKIQVAQFSGGAINITSRLEIIWVGPTL